MGLGIFIEPRDELRSNILDWKDKIKKELPDQPYCSHPPHSTLIHINVTQESKAQLVIKNVLKTFLEFTVETESPHVFWNDKATKGGHTLTWKIRPIKKLYELQFMTAEALRPLLVKSNIPDYVLTNIQQMKSFRRYQFPFIGSHWVPHMTIASLKTDKYHPLINRFLHEKKIFLIKVDKVSLWNVENDVHTHLETIKLQ